MNYLQAVLFSIKRFFKDFIEDNLIISWLFIILDVEALTNNCIATLPELHIHKKLLY